LNGRLLAVCLLALLDKCEKEEDSYPAAANSFNSIELALSVIVFKADTINGDRQSFCLDLRECFSEIHRYWWQQLCEVERRTTRTVDLDKPLCTISVVYQLDTHA